VKTEYAKCIFKEEMTLRSIKKRNRVWKKSLAALVGAALLCGGWNAMAAGNGLEVKKADATVYTEHKEDIAIGDKVNIYGRPADTDAGNKIEAPKSIGIGYGIDIGATGNVPGNVFGANVYAMGENIKVWAYRSLVMGENLNVGVHDDVKVNLHRSWQTNNIVMGYNSSVRQGHIVSLGSDNFDTGKYSVNIGNNLSIYGTSMNVAIGHGVTFGQKEDKDQKISAVNVGNAVGIGAKVTVTGNSAVAIGLETKAEAQEATAVGKGAQATGKYSTAFGGSTQATAESALALGASARASGKGSVASGLRANAKFEASVALGQDSAVTVDKGVTGYNVGTDSVSTLGGNAWTSTLASVAIGNGATKTRQLTGLAAGTADTDAVNVAQLKAAKVKVEKAENSQLIVEKKDPTAAGTTYILDIAKDGTIGGKKDGNLVTGTTVKNYVEGQITGSKVKVEAGDYATVTASDDGKTYTVKGTTIEAGTDGHLIVKDKTDGDKKVGYTLSVQTNGEIKDGNTGIVTGGTVYNAIKDKVSKDDLSSYAKTDGSNITAPGKWAEKLGTGEVKDKDTNLVTGGTVYNALQDSLSGEVSDENKTKGVTGDKIKKYVDGQITGSKVKVEAGDYATVTASDDGKTYTVNGTVIEAGTDGHITVTDKTDGGKKVGYTLSVKTDGKVEKDDKGIVTGGAVHKAIEANKTTVEGDEAKGLTVSKKGNTYKVSLGDKVKVGAVSIDGTKGKETIAVGDTLTMNKDGIALKNGPQLTVDGVDAGSKVIVNVADGKAPTDAVNMRQLMSLGSEWNGRLNEVGAGAAALAALHPLDYDPDNKWDMAVGYGHYRGAHAASLGAYYRPNEYTLFTIGGSLGGGDNMVNVGVSLKVGSGEKDGVIASKADMAKEIKTLKAQNEAILEKSQQIEAENQDMKKELEALKAQVAQLLAK